MSDLQRLRDFAAAHNFDLTRPLLHDHVVLLAEAWRPRMFFFEKEKFFPIALDDAITMVETHFAALTPVRQNDFRVAKLVRDGSGGEFRVFDPPVVHVPDGFVLFANTQLPAVRVLTEGRPAREAFALPEVDGDAVITHGATVGRSEEFFGPEMTLNGLGTATPGDPFLPRADEEDPDSPGERRPRISTMSALLNLLDLLKYELNVGEDGSYPPDGMRRGFDIIDSLLRPLGAQPPVFTPHQKRQFLLEQIASHESNGSIPPPTPPFGWRLDRVAWDTVTRFAFLEYSFFYAYNDFEDYQIAIFDNEHEGDDEGCCLVFDRNSLNLAAGGPDPSALLLRIVPHSIITSVHEEYMDADLFKFIPTPVQNPGVPQPPARDIVDFTVFIAAGSHATYLTGGTHDLVDFGDTWGFVEENAPILLIIAPVILVVAIILAIIEHFVDTEDFTSEDGIHSGPDGLIAADPTRVAQRVIVLPMSSDHHIYDGQSDTQDLLLLRSYAGKWGGTHGIVDNSPQFVAKSGRYFRKLLDAIT